MSHIEHVLYKTHIPYIGVPTNNLLIEEMMKRRIILLIAVSFLLFYSAVFAGECGNFPGRDFESKENQAFKGLYENENYKYSVTIPKGLTGHSSPPDYPQHGFGVVVNWNTHAYIMFDSSANSVEYKTTKEALNSHLTSLRDYGAEIISIKTKKTQLGNHPASRTEIHYRCSKTQENRIKIVVKSLRENRALLDTASIDTTTDRIKADLPIFEKMVSSWRVTGKY